MRTCQAIAGRIIRALGGSVVLLILGCVEPPPFELSPIDPGVDAFEFPPEHLLVSGTVSSNLILTWSNRSTSVLEFVVQKGIGSEPLAEHIRLVGATRGWTDYSVSSLESYTYRIVAIGPAGVSAPATVTTWWEMQIQWESDQLFLSSSSATVAMAMSELTAGTRILVAQADGRISSHTYNGARFLPSGSTVMPKPPNAVAVSPSGDHGAMTTDSTLTVFVNPQSALFSVKSPARLNSPSFSASGFRLMTGGSDGVVRIWRTNTGALLDSLVVPGGPIVECSFDRSDSAIGVLSNAGVVRFYRAGDLSEISSTVVPQGQRISMEDHGRLAIVTQPALGSAQVVRVADGSVVATISGISGLRRAVFLQSTANVLLLGDQPRFRLYDVARGKDLPLPAGLPGDADLVSVGEFGRRIAFSTSQNLISVWYAEPRWAMAR